MEADKILILEDSDKKKNVPKVNDFNVICRICLKEFEEGKSLEEAEQEIKIQSLIESYTPIKIPESNDNFPQQICQECIDFLIQIHIFRSRCLLNDNLLHRICTESTKHKADPMQIYNTEYFLSLSNSINQSVQNYIKKINDELLRTFRCKSCPEVFQTQKDLTQHLLEVKHSMKPTCPCPYCGKKFNRRALQNHIRTHTKEKPFVCEECGTAFTVKHHLTRHMGLHGKIKTEANASAETKEKPFVCEECGASFAIKDYLHRHMKGTHNNKEKTFCCKLCDKKYQTGEHLATHLLVAHKDEQFDLRDDESESFKCFVCQECFKTSDDLMIHIKSHDKSYLCSTCGKVFEGYAHYIQHRRSHSGEKPFVCPTCNKSFRTASILKIHQMTHSDEKPFQCEICQKQFKRLTYLKGHVVSHTTTKSERVKNQCVVCGKGFSMKASLKRHMEIHTGDKKFKCTVCSKQFRQQTHLIYHMRIHNGEKKFACEFCGKAFALNGNLTVHRRMHTGEKPYECEFCWKKFMDSSSRKKHQEKCNKRLMQDVETSKKESEGDENEMDAEFVQEEQTFKWESENDETWMDEELNSNLEDIKCEVVTT